MVNKMTVDYRKRIMLFVGVLIFSLFLVSCSKTQDVLKINLKDHSGLALHIHPTLEIDILGEKQIIPAELGREGNMMRVIHGHDDSGTLHVESPYPHQFYLQDVFTIWGKNFNSTCIFDKCVDDQHTLKVYLNDIEDQRFGAIPLHDLDKIKIVYEKK